MERKTREALLRQAINAVAEISLKIDDAIVPTQHLQAVREQIIGAFSALDGEQKGQLVYYLYQAGLITAGQKVIDLSNTNLSRITLAQAQLPNIDLSGVTMPQANLIQANLTGANLTKADLSWADLYEAILDQVHFNKAEYNDRTRWPNQFYPGKYPLKLSPRKLILD